MMHGWIRGKLTALYEFSSEPGRVPAMEGIRGIAVLLVFWVHFHALFGERLGAGSWAHQLSNFGYKVGNSGVDLFFIMSGFLIYGKLLRHKNGVRQFFGRRIRRIYPAFLCVLAIHLALRLTVFRESSPVPAGAAGMIYVLENVALLPGVLDIRPLFAVAWSLSYEMLFYTALPAVAALTGMRDWTARARCSLWTCAALAYLAFHWSCAGWSIEWLRLSPAAHPRLVLFAAGMLLYEFLAGHPVIRAGGRAEFGAALLSAACLAAYGLLETNAWLAANVRTAISQSALLAIGFPPAVAMAMAGKQWLNRFCCWTPLRWLGNMSYSFYLTHALALQGLHMTARQFLPDAASPFSFLLLLAAALPLTLATATALFTAVEKPFLGSRVQGPRRLAAHA